MAHGPRESVLWTVLRGKSCSAFCAQNLPLIRAPLLPPGVRTGHTGPPSPGTTLQSSSWGHVVPPNSAPLSQCPHMGPMYPALPWTSPQVRPQCTHSRGRVLSCTSVLSWACRSPSSPHPPLARGGSLFRAGPWRYSTKSRKH